MFSAKKLIIALVATCIAASSALAQEKITVRGIVTDAQTGEPLIAVGVLEEGSSNGVITDLDGVYTIKVPKGAILNFSYTGYASQSIAADVEVIDVRMDVDQNFLDEVVVVGYGIQKKSSLTGAVSTVKTADIQSRGVTDLNQALSGKTSGIQSFSNSAKPGAQASVQVRGIGSNANSAPLYVIDGRIASTYDENGNFVSSPGWLNPNDIESVEVLKDGASAAIYGASAGNGVILITTKKGKGDGTISYDMQLASQSLGRKPKLMNAQEFVDYWVDAQMLPFSTAMAHWDGYTDTDWIDVTLGPSLMQKHSVTFQGGSEKGQFYLSGSYSNNDGMLRGKDDTHSVLSAMVNASRHIKSWLEVGTNNVFEYSTVHSVSDGFGANMFLDITGMLPILKPYLSYAELDDAVKPFADEGLVMGNELGYYALVNFVPTNRQNPFILRDSATQESRSFSISGTTYANLNPWPWLTFTTRLSYMLQAGESYTGKHAVFTDPTIVSRALSVSSSNSNAYYWQWENFATALKTFGKHTFTAMLGQSFSENRSVFTGASAAGSETDPGWPFDDDRFLYFAYANNSVTKEVQGGEPIYNRKLAYFGRINYDYAGKYLFQASLRADAADSSILPSTNRWGFFPAASAGWVVSREPFMEGTKSWLGQLKLRVSWGQNGSLASLGNYQYKRTIIKAGTGYPFTETNDYTYAYAPKVMGNDHLKWETSEQLDAGADLAFLSNRLTLSADWYRKETRDLIVPAVRTSYASGFEGSPVNAGSLLNTGVEIEAGWQDAVGDFTYGIRGNLTTLKNQVIKVHDNMDRIPGAMTSQNTAITVFERDMPAWYFYGYKYLGVDQATGDPIFDTGDDGILGPADMQYIGKGIPDLTYGITLNAAWKGIDLTIFGSGVAGVDIYNVYDQSPEYVVNRLAYYNDGRWTAANPTTTKPRNDHYKNQLITSSFNVFDGSYFKIKQIQLGYTFPSKILEKVRLSSVKVYSSLENFFTFSNYVGFDPEVVGAGNGMGVDYGFYPNTRKIIFGLNITF